MAQQSGQRIVYARVSSEDQNSARQLAAPGELDRLFEEKRSGSRRDGRAALAELIAYARRGDTVAVSSMDRLARSVVDLNQIVSELVDKGVAVEFIAERVTFRPGAEDPFAEFQLNIMGSLPSSRALSPRSARRTASERPRRGESIRGAPARSPPSNSSKHVGRSLPASLKPASPGS